MSDGVVALSSDLFASYGCCHVAFSLYFVFFNLSRIKVYACKNKNNVLKQIQRNA